MCCNRTIFYDASEDMSDDPSVRKRLRGLGKTRWREEQTTTESSRFSPLLLKIEAVIQERNFFFMI